MIQFKRTYSRPKTHDRRMRMGGEPVRLLLCHERDSAARLDGTPVGCKNVTGFPLVNWR
jgi:hypothetical protein